MHSCFFFHTYLKEFLSYSEKSNVRQKEQCEWTKCLLKSQGYNVFNFCNLSGECIHRDTRKMFVLICTHFLIRISAFVPDRWQTDPQESAVMSSISPPFLCCTFSRVSAQGGTQRVFITSDQLCHRHNPGFEQITCFYVSNDWVRASCYSLSPLMLVQSGHTNSSSDCATLGLS